MVGQKYKQNSQPTNHKNKRAMIVRNELHASSHSGRLCLRQQESMHAGHPPTIQMFKHVMQTEPHYTSVNKTINTDSLGLNTYICCKLYIKRYCSHFNSIVWSIPNSQLLTNLYIFHHSIINFLTHLKTEMNVY